MDGRIDHISSTSSRCYALSLLSSNSSPNCISASDLSSLSRVALLELIAENRASILAGQLSSHRSCWRDTTDTGGSGALLSNNFPQVVQQVPSQEPALDSSSWNELQQARTQVTLGLMQMPPGSSFEFLSAGRNKDEDECREFYKSFEGKQLFWKYVT